MNCQQSAHKFWVIPEGIYFYISHESCGMRHDSPLQGFYLSVKSSTGNWKAVFDGLVIYHSVRDTCFTARGFAGRVHLFLKCKSAFFREPETKTGNGAFRWCYLDSTVCMVCKRWERFDFQSPFAPNQTLIQSSSVRRATVDNRYTTFVLLKMPYYDVVSFSPEKLRSALTLHRVASKATTWIQRVKTLRGSRSIDRQVFGRFLYLEIKQNVLCKLIYVRTWLLSRERLQRPTFYWNFKSNNLDDSRIIFNHRQISW